MHAFGLNFFLRINVSYHYSVQYLNKNSGLLKQIKFWNYNYSENVHTRNLHTGMYIQDFYKNIFKRNLDKLKNNCN